MNEVKRFKITNILLIFMVLLLLASLLLMLCQRWFIFTLNNTQSLKGVVYVIKKNEPVEPGNLVGFTWQHDTMFYKKGMIFVKIVSGKEGDKITVKNRSVYLNNKFIGTAKEHGRDKKIDLTVTHSHIVPPNEYFVSTPHPDSLDSRYEMVGTINKKIILGRAYEIF